MFMIRGTNVASLLFLCSERIMGSGCLSPSSIPIPPRSPLPFLRQLNKDNCSLLATCSVEDFGVRICLLTDAGGRDTAACGRRDGGGGGNNPEDNVRPCACEVSVWSISDLFRHFQ